MGNSASSNNSNRQRISHLGGKNALGLSKQELDERCQPSGLYKSCQWDEKVIRRMIGDGKLASRKSQGDFECLICFCTYQEINTSVCCSNEICTDCYLQVKPQRTSSVQCPFCNAPRIKVERNLKPAVPREPPKPESLPTQRFGDDEDVAPNTPPSTKRSTAYCLTPEQRKKLEARVAEQQIHPLAARLAQEEAERRLANELNYLSTTPVRRSVMTEEQQIAMAIEASLRTGS